MYETFHTALLKTGACLNGGDCVNVTGITGIITNVDCDCAPGWDGDNCEHGKSFHF